MQCEVVGQEIAIDWLEFGREPVIIAAGDIPEMLMRIDPRHPITPFFKMMLP